ncbi:hypothetical protein amb1548 [Paramagnetospirillum magneticum AMB-1]|uniref:Uncharacterized protein n=1 Tax=Paramagnetospirillum magneticum (strain ATCC 700264 / AMB-1) TaxID=342108 RepID=Q2W723_PARM1|nr:hypothetical protein amb1548 [Paramagnetospirillum magneticum AMB-1]
MSLPSPVYRLRKPASPPMIRPDRNPDWILHACHA